MSAPDLNAKGIGGRPSPRQDHDAWLRAFLEHGIVSNAALEQEAKKRGISAWALRESKSRLRVINFSVPGEEGGEYLGLIGSFVFAPEYFHDEDQTVATATELAQLASQFVGRGDSPEECLTAMLSFAQESPASPPVSEGEVRAIFDKVYTPEQRAAHLAKIEEQRFRVQQRTNIKQEAGGITDVMDWRKRFMESHRRPPTEEENEAKRAERREHLNSELVFLQQQLTELPERTVEYSSEDIDRQEDVAAFIVANRAINPTKKFPVVSRKMAELNELRAKYVGDVRPLTQEELQAETEKLQARIADVGIRLKAVDAYVLPHVTDMSEKGRAYMQEVLREFDRLAQKRKR